MPPKAVDRSYIEKLKERGIDREECKGYGQDLFCELFY